MPQCKNCWSQLIVHNIRIEIEAKVYAHCPTCHRSCWITVPKHIPDEQVKRYLNDKVSKV